MCMCAAHASQRYRTAPAMGLQLAACMRSGVGEQEVLQSWSAAAVESAPEREMSCSQAV